MTTAIQILRVPLTTPCPVPVTPEGETLRDGEAIPMEERTELCAVDAQWLIGAQRCCDIHMAGVFELGVIDGTFEGLVRETFLPYGEDAVVTALARVTAPWSSRKRYSQDEARSWAEGAKEHGLA